MSRIGKLPIKIPSDVEIVCNKSEITVKGKFGTLHNKIPDNLEIQQKDGTLIVVLKNKTRKGNALHGLHRTLIRNMVVGVSEQFELNLQLIGVGYRANVQGKLLVLNLGYSHTVDLEIPDAISVEVTNNTNIKIKSYDKALLGLFAAQVRSWRPPEPYIFKGIKYVDEIIQRKAGKSGK